MEYFFSYMLENRGDYFKSRIETLEEELSKLQITKKNCKI